MSNIIYGVCVNGIHHDVSKSLRGTKCHATREGHTVISRRNFMNGAVRVWCTKIDGQWMLERDNQVKRSIVNKLLKARNLDKRYSLSRVYCGYEDLPYWCGSFCGERVTSYHFSIDEALNELCQVTP